MSATTTAVLGAIAGLTIFLGLPVGRLKAPVPGLAAMLNAVAVGILLFLLWDVLAGAWEPVESAVADGAIGRSLGNGLVMAAAFAAGLVGLTAFDRRIAHRRAGRREGPGAATAAAVAVPVSPLARDQLALLIATGIGLHNFAEGLAIGSSAAAGEINMAVMLVIGFAAHNATEGFGIVAPLTGTRPSWGRLVLLGLIAGGPTFVGTLIGQAFTGELVSIAFLALAGGSILYVIIELLAVLRRADRKLLTSWGLVLGLVLGFATDALLVAAGA